MFTASLPQDISRVFGRHADIPNKGQSLCKRFFTVRGNEVIPCSLHRYSKVLHGSAVVMQIFQADYMVGARSNYLVLGGHEVIPS